VVIPIEIPLPLTIASRSFKTSVIGYGEVMSPSGGRKHISITLLIVRCKCLQLFTEAVISFSKDVLANWQFYRVE
jgi:hypothetical protein